MWRVGFAISGTLLVGVLTMNIQYKQFELLSASKYAGKDFGTLSKLIAASGTIETVDLSKLKPVPMIRDPDPRIRTDPYRTTVSRWSAPRVPPRRQSLLIAR